MDEMRCSLRRRRVALVRSTTLPTFRGGCGIIARPDSAATDEIGEKGTATVKLTTTTQVSVDGVMQGPGGPEEDERRAFERGGRAHFDDEAGTAMGEIYRRADAFLFGRRTYAVFAGPSGVWPEPGDDPASNAL